MGHTRIVADRATLMPHVSRRNKPGWESFETRRRVRRFQTGAAEKNGALYQQVMLHRKKPLT
jgi:hypothetical protein